MNTPICTLESGIFTFTFAVLSQTRWLPPHKDYVENGGVLREGER